MLTDFQKSFSADSAVNLQQNSFKHATTPYICRYTIL